MVNSYQLVNPSIEGNFKSNIKAQNSNEAANLFYNKLAEHFNNSVPEFHFTIKKGSGTGEKFYHYQVKEQRNNNDVQYSIKNFEIQDSDNAISKFKNKLDKFKSKFADPQEGGKKKIKKDKKSKRKNKDESDSSSESDSFSDFDSDNIYKRAKKYLPVNQPIYYWWYDPYVYRLDSVYIPTFYSYVTPYIELSLF
uniref:WGR domain-containing protein n=1 Tax=viral metagenome TaxID=1070528 RepID=A0A6C0EEL8_9ZZZZ